MMWSVALPPATNPVLDDHILGAISAAFIAPRGGGGGTVFPGAEPASRGRPDPAWRASMSPTGTGGWPAR
jgi:hypothetical protein